MLRLALLAAASLSAALTSTTPMSSTEDPPKPKDPEPAQPVCTNWTGTVSGNDPSVAIRGTLCEDAKGNVSGQLAWSSARSGSNLRQVSGAWSGDHTSLTLADGAILESHPNPGWRFCVVDRYSLAGSKDALSGSYHSSGCNDDASITLARVP